jgi:hypothetical protein
MSKLAEKSIHAWLIDNEIKNEKGDLITFDEHLFLYDIYRDQSPKLVVMKAAQVGLSTLEVLKNIYDAKHHKMDIIYTLPTNDDVRTFVSGKVNRIISNNPVLQGYTADQDSIEQKMIGGQSMLYFRGTWDKRKATMVTADRLVHDEKDSSKQDVIADYQARMQHSKFGQTHVFSHPSVAKKGVHQEWLQSDQREFFITCPHCKKMQYLEWNLEDDRRMSVDIERKEFICKACKGILSATDRSIGEWIPKKFVVQPEWRGYHVSLLMAPYQTASQIVKKYQEVLDGEQTMDFFYNKILGLPYAGGGNVVTEDMILGAVTGEMNNHKGRMVIGVDTGIALRYVIGNKEGLMGFGEMKDYSPDATNKLLLNQTLEYFLVKFPNSIMVIDQGGDIIGSRKLRQKYPGRVFLCHYAADRKTMQLIRWGEKDESGNVLVDRNRMMQLVIDEVKDRRWKLFNGTKGEWHDYWLHWSHIYRVWVEDMLGIPRYKWLRDGRDDWVHATIYWRVGVDRFGTGGAVFGAESEAEPNSYMMNANGTVTFNPEELFKLTEGLGQTDDDDEWR